MKHQPHTLAPGVGEGGLVAAQRYHAHPKRFRSYLLLAPTLEQPAAEPIAQAPGTGKIIHSARAPASSLAAGRAFANKFQLALEGGPMTRT